MKSKRRKTRKAIFIIAVFTFLVYFSYNFLCTKKTISSMENELNELKIEIDELSNENEELSNFKDEVDNIEYVEKVAREKLGMIKEDEKIFIDINE